MGYSISVIIPVYNGAAFVEEALRSLCEQTLRPCEAIVADDCSTDNTCEIVESFARNAPFPVRLMRMGKNTGGPYGPASKAFHLTRGQFVTILDCDDKFAPDAFATYMAMFEADPSPAIGLVTSDWLWFDDNGVVMPSYFRHAPDRVRQLERVLADQTGLGVILTRDEAVRIMCADFCLPFKGMLRRETWEELGGPNLRYRIVCDCEFTWNLARHPKLRIRVVPRTLMHVRSHCGSMSRNYIPLSKELVRLYRTVYRQAETIDNRRIVRKRLCRELFELTYQAYKQRDINTILPAGLQYLGNRMTSFVAGR